MSSCWFGVCARFDVGKVSMAVANGCPARHWLAAVERLDGRHPVGVKRSVCEGSPTQAASVCVLAGVCWSSAGIFWFSGVPEHLRLRLASDSGKNRHCSRKRTQLSHGVGFPLHYIDVSNSKKRRDYTNAVLTFVLLLLHDSQALEMRCLQCLFTREIWLSWCSGLLDRRRIIFVVLSALTTKSCADGVFSVYELYNAALANRPPMVEVSHLPNRPLRSLLRRRTPSSTVRQA